MKNVLDWFDALPQWSLAILTVFIIFVLLEVIKRLVLHTVLKVLEKKKLHTSTIILKGLSQPLTIWFIALSIKLMEQVMLHFNEHFANSMFNIGAKLLVVIGLVLFVDKILSALLGRYAEKNITLKTSKSIIQTLVHIVILSVGTLIILSTMGIAITPIIASLGITSLAIALALQPTLSNFFAGVQLVIDKPIRVGDYVELDSGEQGFVEKIGWNTTWIKMLPNNVIIVPNSMLSNAKLINYYYPEKELSVPVEVGVHYDSDLEHVEKVTLEVAREVLHTHKWGVDDYDTFVVFHTFDNSSINFTVMLRTKEYFNRFFIKSAFIKALHQRYREEGITIPYPIRAINIEQEKGTSTSFDIPFTSTQDS